MSTPNAPSAAQALVTLVESDILIAAGGPILTFLQEMQKNPNPIAAALYFTQLQGALLGSLPSLESAAIEQLAGTLNSKISSLLTAAQAAVAAPPAA
jgi:hypothetical protein